MLLSPMQAFGITIKIKLIIYLNRKEKMFMKKNLDILGIAGFDPDSPVLSAGAISDSSRTEYGCGSDLGSIF